MKKKKERNKCLNPSCSNIPKQLRSKYCSYKCYNEVITEKKIKLWLDGKHNGMRGKTSTARWIKEYLMKQKEGCWKCGWNEINIYTEKKPLELNHIDGNYKNNKINNLEILCPNCHALTKNYKGANKDKGRPRKKYYRGL